MPSAERIRVQDASQPYSYRVALLDRSRARMGPHNATRREAVMLVDTLAIAPTSDAPASPERAKPTVAHMLGEVCWVLSQSKYHKHFSLGDLEWMAMPPILANQFRVFHGPEKAPVGFAIWAYVSEEVEQRLCAQVESGAGARLKPEDWKSGDRLWLIELVALGATEENKLTQAMLADLATNVFPGRKFKLHSADPLTGKRKMKEFWG
jgi:cytolysin-activating lysine-acyltransferase